MDRKKVLVTGVGGNVGQGIIRNIRECNYDIFVVGCNIVEVSAGNHLCDAFYHVPYAYEDGYLPRIIKIVSEQKIDLIIPSTDYEVYYLARHSKLIGVRIATSGEDSTGIYLDKYLTFLHHKKFNVPFAPSFLPSEYSGQFSEAIAKPRKGRGSRGLIFNPQTWDALTDDEYMIQELYKGVEVTTAVYASYKTGKLHGLISMERTLEKGVTTYCRVIRDYDEDMKKIASQMIEHFALKGSFNIQSIITPAGDIIPFEVNCRISGTNSIRSHFGFKDVKYTIDELLYDKVPEAITISNGTAYRYLTDVIYPTGLESGNRSDNFIVF